MFSSRTNWRFDRNRFTQALDEHRSGGGKLYDLTGSNPTDCGLIYPTPEILAALGDARSLAYRPESKGLLEARTAVSQYYESHRGFSGEQARPNLENILLTSGTSEGYSHIFRLLCEPGDEVLVPAPSYPLFEFLADLADVRLAAYSLVYDQGWQINFASLQASTNARTRAILVVHPNNPTGSFVKAREAAALAEICAPRGIAIVADEVFLDYADRAELARTFAFEREALTFTLSGLSKICLLPQMKLAWIAVSGPANIARSAVERLEIIADTYLSPGTPVQLALPRFLDLRAGLQNQLRARIATNLDVLGGILRQNNTPVALLEREGGWYATLRVPATQPDESLAVDILRRCSVVVHPGNFFNFARDGYLIVSLIADTGDFEEGMRRLVQFFSA